MKQNIKELMNEHRQTKEFQKNASSPVKYENDFITGLKLLRKKLFNTFFLASFMAASSVGPVPSKVLSVM